MGAVFRRIGRFLRDNWVYPPDPIEVERDKSRKNWLLLRQFLADRRAVKRPLSPMEREAFELLRAATVYQFDAKHSGWSMGGEKWRPFWYNMPEEHFEAFMDYEEPYISLMEISTHRSDIVGRMHLASSAVRIPIALQKVIGCRPLAAVPFQGLVPLWNSRRSDWDRGKVRTLFDEVRRLGDCSTPLGATSQDALRNAITIVLVIRDEFGHGETGDAEGARGDLREYIEGRQEVADDIFACRVIQAQETLVRWAVDSLRQDVGDR